VSRGRAHASSGFTDGNGASGTRRWWPSRYSPIVESAEPFFRPGATGLVLWKTPSLKRGEARIFSRRAPKGRLPNDSDIAQV